MVIDQHNTHKVRYTTACILWLPLALGVVHAVEHGKPCHLVGAVELAQVSIYVRFVNIFFWLEIQYKLLAYTRVFITN